MTLLVLGVLGVVALLIFAILLPGRSKSSPPERKPAPARRSSSAPPAPAPDIPAPSRQRNTGTRTETVDRFRGTTLFPQPQACAAAQAMRGKTFEGTELLSVPLPGCHRSRCDCQVHDVVGRRRSPRRVVLDRRSDVRFASDRRQGVDRREAGETSKEAKD